MLLIGGSPVTSASAKIAGPKGRTLLPFDIRHPFPARRDLLVRSREPLAGMTWKPRF